MKSTGNQPSDRRLGVIFSLLAAMSSGLMLPLGKPNAASTGPLVFLFAICSIAGLMMLPAALSRPLAKTLATPRVRIGFGLHVCFSAAALILLWEGTSQINPAIAGFLSNTHIVFAVLLSVVVLGESIGFSSMVGGFLILTGIVVMRGSGLDIGAWMTVEPSWLMVIASAALFAMADLAIKLSAGQVEMLPYLGLRNLILAAIFGSICLATNQAIDFGSFFTVSIFGTALFGIIGSRLFFNLALQRIPLSQSSLIFQVQPLFVALFTYLMTGELPTYHEWLGGMVIMGGVTVVLWRR